ncbi:hypothetical protein PHYPSEUDO_000904 [Phytophthora pseudosyringae]|uniref:Uncharacterized protein n=1 Tax=Phytophthora pseudosyringae TaxID=221518 RepID=A0A8T1VWW9_9STRA|nr:hypothetical protein PHYPSEUDO_000904 [Phytophthora pseudosyringae]
MELAFCMLLNLIQYTFPKQGACRDDNHSGLQGQSFSAHLSPVEGSETLPGPLELPVSCVVLAVHGSQLSNAVKETANLLTEQGHGAAVWQEDGALHARAQRLDARHHQRQDGAAGDQWYSQVYRTSVFDLLLRTVLKFQLLANGCLQFGKRNQMPQVLTMINEPRSGEVQTTAILNVVLITVAEGRSVIELVRGFFCRSWLGVHCIRKFPVVISEHSL